MQLLPCSGVTSSSNSRLCGTVCSAGSSMVSRPVAVLVCKKRPRSRTSPGRPIRRPLALATAAAATPASATSGSSADRLTTQAGPSSLSRRAAAVRSAARRKRDARKPSRSLARARCCRTNPGSGCSGASWRSTSALVDGRPPLGCMARCVCMYARVEWAGAGGREGEIGTKGCRRGSPGSRGKGLMVRSVRPLACAEICRTWCQRHAPAEVA